MVKENKESRLNGLLTGCKAVIFDFDNIIVDSEPYHFESYRQVFEALGHKLNREEYWIEWTSKGGGAEGEIKRYNLPFDPAEIRKKKDPIYSSFCQKGLVKPFPEARKIIELLSWKNYTLAIASGSYEEDIKNILRIHNLQSYFSAIVGKDKIKKYKPDPETYLRALEKIKVSPEKCIAIEDAEKGIKSAHGAGLKVILVKTEITRNLKIDGADLEVSGLNELQELLNRVLSN